MRVPPVTLSIGNRWGSIAPEHWLPFQHQIHCFGKRDTQVRFLDGFDDSILIPRHWVYRQSNRNLCHNSDCLFTNMDHCTPRPTVHSVPSIASLALPRVIASGTSAWWSSKLERCATERSTITTLCSVVTPEISSLWIVRLSVHYVYPEVWELRLWLWEWYFFTCWCLIVKGTKTPTGPMSNLWFRWLFGHRLGRCNWLCNRPQAINPHIAAMPPSESGVSNGVYHAFLQTIWSPESQRSSIFPKITSVLSSIQSRIGLNNIHFGHFSQHSISSFHHIVLEDAKFFVYLGEIVSAEG